MGNQITRHAVAGGRQEATPGHFEVFDGRAIAATGVVAGGGLKVTIQLGHGVTHEYVPHSRALNRFSVSHMG
ncbi:hypothetical protein D9M71_839340 [compost metagenome]